jgi:ubiquinone biosynthesis accessory factor UbiJ
VAAFGFDPSAIPPTLANRVLEREAWAQDCLAAHAGKVFAVTVGPVSAALAIDAFGKFAAAPRRDTPPDLTLTLGPLAVPSFLAEPARWHEFVAATGDPALAATLKGLAETLPWFVERAFAGVLGPIVGLRVADAGRHLLAFPAYAASHVGDSVRTFARDEAGLAASGQDGQTFGEQSAAVAQRVDALAARLDALEARLNGAAPEKSAG